MLSDDDLALIDAEVEARIKSKVDAAYRQGMTDANAQTRLDAIKKAVAEGTAKLAAPAVVSAAIQLFPDRKPAPPVPSCVRDRAEYERIIATLDKCPGGLRMKTIAIAVRGDSDERTRNSLNDKLRVMLARGMVYQPKRGWYALVRQAMAG